MVPWSTVAQNLFITGYVDVKLETQATIYNLSDFNPAA